NGGFSAKFNGSTSIELLDKTEHLCFDFRHFAKLQNVSGHPKRRHNGQETNRQMNRQANASAKSKEDHFNVDLNLIRLGSVSSNADHSFNIKSKIETGLGRCYSK